MSGDTSDPVLALCDRMLADIQHLSDEVTRLVHEYGTLRRDTASKLADSTPKVVAARMEKRPGANTVDALRYAVGRTVIGVLRDALPAHRPDLSRGTRTLIFDDGTGLTFASNGSFWTEAQEDVKRAVDKAQSALDEVTGIYRELLDLAGSGRLS